MFCFFLYNIFLELIFRMARVYGFVFGFIILFPRYPKQIEIRGNTFLQSKGLTRGGGGGNPELRGPTGLPL